MVSLLVPGVKGSPGATGPDHQSHAVLPGLIQEVSAMAEGSLRLRMVVDSMSLPGSCAMSSTRHGEAAGALALTQTCVWEVSGESLATRLLEPVLGLSRYMPAQSFSRASVRTAVGPDGR